MTICTDHDSEVCYESRKCPACELQASLDKAMAEINDLKDRIADLEAQI